MFKTNYKVTIQDINYGGHMGNQVPLILFHQGRLEFLKKYNLSELNIGDNVGTLQRESWVKYNREIFNFENLEIVIKNIVIEKLTAIFEFNVINEKGEVALEGTTTMIGYNHELKKVAKIPESFKNLVESLKVQQQNKIKNVIFDLGMVLIDFKPKKFIEKNVEPQDREEFYKEVFANKEWQDLDRGTLSYENAVKLFSEKLPKYKNLIQNLFDNNILDCLEPIEENINIMKELKKKGYKLYVLSNFHQPSFNYVFSHWDFFENFDGKVVSSHVKLMKPEPEIYSEILGKYNLKPEETLFIDDSAPNIEAAKKFNINVIHLVEPKELAEKIKEFGL